jgi:hypothetical protein
MDRVQLENSGEIIYTHPNFACKNQVCTIHNRTTHKMRHLPQHWRVDRSLMERICEHGVGHPDPDEYKIRGESGKWELVHGCDGCCEGAYDSL